jgi:hypothetical protein
MMAIRGEKRGIGYIGLQINIRPPLQEKRDGSSVTIGTSPHKSTPAILQRKRDGDQRREGLHPVYLILNINICLPLQEKRGGGTLTILTGINKSSPAILQRENYRDGNDMRK